MIVRMLMLKCIVEIKECQTLHAKNMCSVPSISVNTYSFYRTFTHFASKLIL